MGESVDTSDEACAVACMLVSNPGGALRKDGDGWQKRVNDLIRALRDERNRLRSIAGKADVGPSFSELTNELRHQTPHES